MYHLGIQQISRVIWSIAIHLASALDAQPSVLLTASRKHTLDCGIRINAEIRPADSGCRSVCHAVINLLVHMNTTWGLREKGYGRHSLDVVVAPCDLGHALATIPGLLHSSNAMLTERGSQRGEACSIPAVLARCVDLTKRVVASRDRWRWCAKVPCGLEWPRCEEKKGQDGDRGGTNRLRSIYTPRL